MSLFPFAEGHCLALPKKPFSSFVKPNEAVGQEIFTLTQRLAQCIGEVTSCDWVQLMMHDDVLEGAHLLEPFHRHPHILPRVKAVPYFEERPEKASRNQLDKLAKPLKSVYFEQFSLRHFQ